MTHFLSVLAEQCHQRLVHASWCYWGLLTVGVGQGWTAGSLLLFYAIATVFHLYHGSDMMYEMRRKPKPTPLQTHRIFNLPHHISMVWEVKDIDDTVSMLLG